MMLVGSASFACAQEEKPVDLKVTPSEFVQGTETVITVSYETAVPHNAFQMDVTLPKGLTIVGKEGVDEDGDPTTVYLNRGDALLPTHTFLNNYNETSLDKETGVTSFRLVSANPKLKNMKSSGSLFSFTVKVGEELADKAQILLTNIKFNGAPYFEQSFDITKSTVPTGINGVEAEAQTTDAVYSIGGVRLNKAAKGVNVVIRNGKAIKVVK